MTVYRLVIHQCQDCGRRQEIRAPVGVDANKYKPVACPCGGQFIERAA